jgi:uncharacterized protein YdaU (DUF1376 family)
MDALPWYKWHWNDYRANRKVQRMSWQAKGLYRELLDEFWSEGPLPNDPASLADICGCTLQEFSDFWPQISPCWKVVDGLLVNEKMEKQRTQKDLHRVKMADAGRSGAKAKIDSANAGKSLPNAGNCHIEEETKADEEHEQRKEEKAPDLTAITPSMVAQAVLTECCLAGEDLVNVITDVVKAESKLPGYDPTALRNKMVTAWREFEAASPKLTQYAPRTVKFFGAAHWRTKSNWGWKEGMEPKPQRVYANVNPEESLIDKARRQKAS